MNRIVPASLICLAFTLPASIAAGAVTVGYNSGTIIINDTVTGAQTSCPPLQNGISDETIQRVAEAAAKAADQSGSDWKGAVDTALAGLQRASGANARRLNAIATGQAKIAKGLETVRGELAKAKADNDATHATQLAAAQALRERLATTEANLLGALDQLRQEEDADQRSMAVQLEELEQSVVDLQTEIRDTFDEYLPSNPALRVATQVGLRWPGPLALFAGQASYAGQLSARWMLGVAIGGAFSVPVNDGREGGYQGPGGNIIESIKYKEHVALIEGGAELRYGPTNWLRISFQALFRHSFVVWRTTGAEPEVSYGSRGLLGRGGVDFLIWGPIFVGAVAALGTDFSSQEPSRKYTGVLGNLENPIQGGRRTFVEGGVGVGLAVFP